MENDVRIKAVKSRTSRPFYYVQIEDDEYVLAIKAKDEESAKRMAERIYGAIFEEGVITVTLVK